MLYTLDIVIGFTLIMLILSMVVTMLTQLIGSELTNMRGQALRSGVARLLVLLDNGLVMDEARRVADHLLRNPLIAKSAILKPHKLATVVQREELVRLILDFAINGVGDKANPNAPDDLDRLRDKLRNSLAKNGIPDPAAVLDRVRAAVLELEKTNPELSNAQRVSIALLNFAASPFLARLNGWFDQTIDRVSDVFTSRIRWVTVSISIVLAFLVQLDTFQLINRLSANPQLVSSLAEDAVMVGGQAASVAQPAQPAAATPPPRAADDDSTFVTGNTSDLLADDAAPRNASIPGDASHPPTVPTNEVAKAELSKLEDYGIIAFPRSGKEWAGEWSRTTGGNNLLGIITHLLGIILTAALLSLGSPWWYAMLGNLLKLRSMVSQRDDQQRAERQTSQAPGGAAPVIPPAFAGGGAGDRNGTA